MRARFEYRLRANDGYTIQRHLSDHRAPYSIQELSAISVPALVVWCREDQITPLKWGEDMRPRFMQPGWRSSTGAVIFQISRSRMSSTKRSSSSSSGRRIDPAHFPDWSLGRTRRRGSGFGGFVTRSYCSEEIDNVSVVCQHCGRDWKSGVSQVPHASSSGPVSRRQKTEFCGAFGRIRGLLFLVYLIVSLVLYNP